MLRFEQIDRRNFRAIVNLRVYDEQSDFVASNLFSLAEAYVKPENVPLALYAGNEPVGFCMYGFDNDDHAYWICRLMIDKRFQGRGYGREAMRMLIDRIRAEDETQRDIYISFEPENKAAKALYASLGFRPDGRVLDGEIVYALSIVT